MSRTKNNPLKVYAIYSIIAHIVIFICGAIPFFLPSKGNMLLMDIELAGEGELKEILDYNKEELPKSALPPEDMPEIKSKAVIEENLEPTRDEPALHIPENSQDFAPDPDTKDAEAVKKVENPEESDQKDIEEEPIPKAEAEKPKEKPVIEEKKKKVRNKQALMDVIKSAEKKKAREKSRQKVLELASAAAKKKKNDAFNDMLSSSIADMKKNSGKGKKGIGIGKIGEGNSLSDGDYAMISSQVYPHWIVPSGVRDAENIIIEIRVQLRDGGLVIPSSIKILDEKRYATDYIFRAAADSARRAILEASPLNIPKDKIDLFRDFVFCFNLKDTLGR
jgi:hypothetical protein